MGRNEGGGNGIRWLLTKEKKVHLETSRLLAAVAAGIESYLQALSGDRYGRH